MGKRLGGHELVLGRLARHSTTAAIPSLVSPLRPPADIPHEARQRALAEAERIVAGEITIYGRVLSVGPVPDWHAVIDGPGSWPVAPWWQIDLRSSARVGDVKWTWELGRHRHLVVLARAAHLEPDDDRWLSTLERHLRSWLDANPLEMGVHWASNLELSLRSVAWLQIVGLVGDRIDPALLVDMTSVLWHTGRHLLVELPYTVSTMANNHLLGDALGLAVLGRSFPDRTAARWASLGDRLFARQARREFRPDGSTIDESLSYQRFVMEMLVVRALLDGPGRDEAVGHLARSGQYLARLGVLTGPVPPYGDWDEGRLLVASAPPDDLVGTTLAALALAGSGAQADQRQRHDEVAWYVPEGTPLEPDPATSAGAVGGGIARASCAGTDVWLRAGVRTWHGHADLGSVEIAVRDDADGGSEPEWLVGDPGTGTYNGDPVIRDGFRSSAAHSVLRVEGIDQLEPHRVFRWRHSGTAVLGDPLVLDDLVVLWCVHDAYRRLTPPRSVVRVVLVDRVDGGVAVADWVSGQPVAFALTLPLGPGREWAPADGQPRHGSLSRTDGQPDWHLALPAAPSVAVGDTNALGGLVERYVRPGDPFDGPAVQGPSRRPGALGAHPRPSHRSLQLAGRAGRPGAVTRGRRV